VIRKEETVLFQVIQVDVQMSAYELEVYTCFAKKEKFHMEYLMDDNSVCVRKALQVCSSLFDLHIDNFEYENRNFQSNKRIMAPNTHPRKKTHPK